LAGGHAHPAPHGRHVAHVKQRKRAAGRLFETAVRIAVERPEQAEAWIEAELATIVPALEWVVPFLLQDKRFGYIGDAHLLPGFCETIELLGGVTRFALVTNAAHHLGGFEPAGRVEALLAEPRVATMLRFLRDRLTADQLDCLVTNATCIDAARTGEHAVFEFGFPAYEQHALYDRPNLGFRGFLAFVDSLANQLRMFASRRDALDWQDRIAACGPGPVAVREPEGD
jgi:nitrogenase molybdenum-iron protein alpha/beta subunit